MKTKTWVLSGVDFIVWIIFAYYALYALKNPVYLWQASVILVILGTAGTYLCPWFQNTDAWERMKK